MVNHLDIRFGILEHGQQFLKHLYRCTGLTGKEFRSELRRVNIKRIVASGVEAGGQRQLSSSRKRGILRFYVFFGVGIVLGGQTFWKRPLKSPMNRFLDSVPVGGAFRGGGCVLQTFVRCFGGNIA